MEITVISEEENPMLHRTDVTFRVSHVEATPDRLAVRDSLAARLNKDADEVVVRKLDTKFGMRTTIGEAKVYEGPEFAKDVEQQHMLARNKIAVGEDGEPADEADEPASEPGEEAADVAEEEAPEEETAAEAEGDEAPTDDEGTDEPEADDESAEDAAEAGEAE